jgi:hypothetical protein
VRMGAGSGPAVAGSDGCLGVSRNGSGGGAGAADGGDAVRAAGGDLEVLMRGATMFSGICAPETALPEIDLRWCAEVEPFCRALISERHPDVPNLGDVTAGDFIERALALGPLDVLVAGSPCQAFSVAGNRNSLSAASISASRGSEPCVRDRARRRRVTLSAQRRASACRGRGRPPPCRPRR